MRTITRTKAGTFTLAALLMLTGVILDTSGSAFSEAMHHIAFVLSGVVLGTLIRR
jgi:hypothetical protein